MSLLRGALLLLGPAISGAVLGAIALVLVLNDDMGMPKPATAPAHDGAWLLFNSAFALMGGAIGGAIGLVVGMGALVWYIVHRRDE